MENLPGAQTLTRSECLARLGQASLGRIGVSMDALPAILPVFYALEGQSILLHTVPGTKLDAATRNTVVAFQVDAYDAASFSGWSVMAQGIAARISDPAELARTSEIVAQSWPSSDERRNLVRIEIAQLSGRQFSRLDGTPQS